MKYVIIGASAAGISAAKTIRHLDKEGEILIVSKDENVYSRCMLHHIIGGNRDVEGLSFIEKDFFKNRNITWKKGVSVEKVDFKQKKIIMCDGSEDSYDKILIASGSNAFIPPVENLREAQGVYPLRNLEDALSISKISNDKTVMVIGAGLVGVDAAVGLLEKGVKVHVVEMADRILPLQLDSTASKRYQELLQNHGAEVHTGVAVSKVRVDSHNNVSGVVLSNDETLSCDMIVVAAGVRANTSFIQDDSLKINRGIIIDSQCRTSVEDVFAAGDVCGKSPIWPMAVKQGITAAYNMTGKERFQKDTFALRNSMNFFGLETVSIGDIFNYDDSYTVDMINQGNVYKKVIHKDGIIQGILFQGDISYCGVYMELIKNRIDISKSKGNILDIDFSSFYGIKENGEYAYII